MNIHTFWNNKTRTNILFIAASFCLIGLVQTHEYETMEQWEQRTMDGIDCMYDQAIDPVTEQEVRELAVMCEVDGYEWSLEDYNGR